MAEFKGRIAGRFYSEFYFYLIVFLIAAYLAFQPQRNPWLVVLAVLSGLLAVEMTYILYRNYLRAQASFASVDKQKIIVSDAGDVDSIAWTKVDEVTVAWFSKDKWLEKIFGLDPSILVRKKGSKKGEFEFAISPDFYHTPKILAEMQRLYPKKIVIPPIPE